MKKKLLIGFMAVVVAAAAILGGDKDISDSSDESVRHFAGI